MRLPEMTSSARVARAFQRFARGAGVGLALGALAACGGGGGSSTPAKTTPTPEMTITPPAPTAEDIASATDVTGRDTIEGRLDSANPRAFYKIRIDEPTVLALRSEDDIDVTVYDGSGNVVPPSTAEQAAVAPRAASAGGGGGHAEVAIAPAAAIFWFLGGTGTGAGAVAGTGATTWLIRIGIGAAAAGVGAALPYALRLGTARLALRQTADLPEVRLGVEEEQEINIEESFDGEKVLTATWTVTPTITTPFGTLRLFKVENKVAVRVSHVRSEQCPTGTERSWTGKGALTARWTQSVPLLGDGIPLSREFEMPVTVGSMAPRRKAAGPREIAVTVPGGGSETVVLTDFIEDPQGGALTFERSPTSAPGRWSSVLAGPRLTFTAGTTGGASTSTVTVTATDPARECWNFPMQVRVGEAQVRVKPEYADGITESLVYGQTYTSRDLNEFFDNPLNKLIGFGVARASDYPNLSKDHPQVGPGGPQTLSIAEPEPTFGLESAGLSSGNSNLGWNAGVRNRLGRGPPSLKVDSFLSGYPDGDLLPGDRASVVVTAGYLDDNGTVPNAVGLRFTFTIRAPRLAPGRTLPSSGCGRTDHACVRLPDGRWCVSRAGHGGRRGCFPDLVIPSSSTRTGSLSRQRETLPCGGRPMARTRICAAPFLEILFPAPTP